MRISIPKPFRSFIEDDCFNLAAIISFYAIFSLIPLAMISVSMIGYLVGARLPGVISEINSLLSSVVPNVTEGVVQNIHNIVARKVSLGWVGIVSLILTASFLFSSLEHALDKVFRSAKKRNFFHSWFISVVLIFVVALLIFIPALLRPAIVYLEKFGWSIPLVQFFTADMFFMILSFLAFILFVTVIPTHNVMIRYSAMGAVIFTALTGLARYIFRVYIVASWSRYDLIYGSLTALIVVIIWIYYLSVIFLLSAEIVARFQERRKNVSV